jgi:hypothetical protein
VGYLPSAGGGITPAQITNLPAGTPKPTDLVPYADITPAVSRVMRGTATDAGTPDAEIIIGGLTIIVGDDVDGGTDNGGYAENLVAFIEANLGAIPAESIALDPDFNPWFNVTFPEGANTALVTTNDPNLSFEEITEGVDEVSTMKKVEASGLGGAGYLVYTALLTQSGTDAPVATVLENTLGGTVVWARSGVGTYSATLADAFTENKTWLGKPDVDGQAVLDTEFQLSAAWSDADHLIYTNTNAVGENVDGLGRGYIEIRVYP